MTELAIQPRGIIKVRVGEQVFEVKKPSNRQLKEFQAASKDTSAPLDLLVSMLANLGFPEDMAWDLGPEALEQIVEALVPKKKA